MKSFTEKQRLKNIICYTGLAFLIAGTGYAIYRFTGIGLKCPINYLTGLKCPGCGNTHVLGCLLKLDIRGAFKANLMFLPEFLYLIWVYVFASVNYIKKGIFNYTPPYKFIDISLLIIIILWGIIRNILHI